MLWREALDTSGTRISPEFRITLIEASISEDLAISLYRCSSAAVVQNTTETPCYCSRA